MQICSDYIHTLNINNVLCIFNECMNLFVYNILIDKLDIIIFFILRIEEFNVILIEMKSVIIVCL